MSDSPPPRDPPPAYRRTASVSQGATGSGSAPSGDGLTRFFDRIRSLGIVRGDDRWFAGVLGGIAASTGLAPTAVRIVVILFGILGAPVLFAYVVAWALLPDLRGRIHAEQALRGVFEPVIIAIVVLLIAAFPPFGGTALWRWPWTITGLPDWISTMLSVVWGIAITIGIVWLIVYLVRQASAGPAGPAGPAADTRADTGAGPDDTGAARAHWAQAHRPQGPAPAGERPPLPTEQRQWSAAWSAQPADEQVAVRQARARQAAERAAWHRDTRPGAAVTAIVLGLGLVLGALTAGIYSGGDFTNEAFVLGLAALLAVLALGVIVEGLLGRRSGGMGGFALLTILALVPAAIFPFGSQVSLFGAPYWDVTSSNESHSFAALAGQPTIDLSGLTSDGSGPAVVNVWLGLGQTRVIVPRDEPVRIDAIETTPPPEGARSTPFSARERGPLFGTVVWGLILLAVAAIFAVPILYGPIENPSLWILWGIAVLGFLLLAAGIVAAVRRAR
ncbi:PspC domain-containing protein [Marisediminicola antarctica]|uniref:Phage shock protein PspC N-terminal domain-containing protein n=1 Tax=Marisediminicola antarctica TaxID=674079 RepID=A0A7L5AJ48_9MICO|nr:PspC domain-containing protein [Marisediminicola antarctica]QHO69424.1 hypothetical protein BHD05_06955 [Marisediminicola antarctica]